MSVDFIEMIKYRALNPTTKQEHAWNMAYIFDVAGRKIDTVLGIELSQENSREIVKHIVLAHNRLIDIDWQRLKFILTR